MIDISAVTASTTVDSKAQV